MDRTSSAPGTPGLFAHLRHDVPAAVVVFLVALPLCLGIALASGVPLLSGLVAGIVGGLVVAWLSGSQLSVSGPAAGLVVMVIDSISTLGSFEAFLPAVVLAGALQWVFGHARAGELGACFPASVIKGMLAAIGLLLIIKQLPVAFGFASTEHALQHLPGDGEGLEGVREALGAVTESALVVAAGALALLFAWELPAVRRLPVIGRLPGPLVAVLWGVSYQAVALIADPTTALAGHQRVVLPRIDSLGSLWAQLPAPDWSALGRSELYAIAISLAVVASLESLLSLEAADRLDPLKRTAPPNRELQAQGAGNMVSGLLGGLPLTAVIVRTSANVQAGARTRLSAVLHGVLLMVSLLFLTEMLHMIPLAALAAVLLHTGVKLAKPAIFVATWREGVEAFVPFVVTVAAILATDLLVGILVGLGCSMIFVIRTNTRDVLKLTSHGSAHLLQLCKDVSFFSKAALRRDLSCVKPGHSLIIDGSRCRFLDHDIRETLNDFLEHAREFGIQVELRSMPVGAEVLTRQPATSAQGVVAQQAA